MESPDASPSADRDEEERRARKREYNRRWKADNPEKVKESRNRFRTQHREQVLQEGRDRERARRDKARKERAAAERRRVEGRARYAADPAAHLEYQRERRAAQRAADPAGYREAKRLRNKRWRDGHREQENAKLRAKHRENPELKSAAAARYYAEHGDEVRERRRAYYWANREKQLEAQRRWREREKRRREVGLPPRRLHRVLSAERGANLAAADEFFSRPRGREQIALVRGELRTDEHELARWERDCERARAASGFAASVDPLRPITASERRAKEREEATQHLREVEQAEEARLDAIARAINDQLRFEPRRHVHDPVLEHPVSAMTSPSTRGVSR